MPRPNATPEEHALAHLSAAQLNPVITRLLGEAVTVQTWQTTLLGGLDSSPMAGGVFHVTGTAVDPAATPRCWDVVVKVLRSPEGITMPDGTHVGRDLAENARSFGYWRREALVAESDLLTCLPAGLRAPRSLGITRISPRERWLWQEYLPADAAWTWDQYRAAAFRLGRWQAPAQKRPTYPWLVEAWMDDWVHGPLTRIFTLVEGMDGFRHPLLTAYFSAEELAAVRRLWTDWQRCLDRLAQLPQVLCHLDAHRGNLSWQAGDLALLDWAFVGQGALGEELAAFVGGTLLLDYAPLSAADRLEQAAFDGYVAGLRAAGWTGSVTTIRDAYHCAMPLRYALASLASMLRTVVQPEFAANWERQTGKPLADILTHRAGLIRFYLSRLGGQSRRRPTLSASRQRQGQELV